MYPFINNKVNNIFVNNLVDVNLFIPALQDLIKDHDAKFGKRKKKMNITIRYGNNPYHKFEIESNKTYLPTGILKDIMVELEKKYRVSRHQNINRYINDFEKFVKSITGYTYENDEIVIHSTGIVDQERAAALIAELSDYITECQKYKEHIKSVVPDFTNYMDREPNRPVNFEKLYKYIDILIKYADVIDLQEYTNIMFYFYESGWSSGSAAIKRDLFSIKEKLTSLINYWLKYTHDVVDIYPSNIGNVTVDNILKIDFLDFSAMYSDNAIAVQKHLAGVRSTALAAEYASHQPGQYVGD